MNQRTERMWTRTLLTALLALAVVANAPAARADDDLTLVLVETPLGSFQIELFPDVAPVTVTNFLRYVNGGNFQDSFIHRSVPGFVLQGGGFIIHDDGGTSSVATNPPIVNEFSLSNVRGTLAMAKIDGDPNSATSQWFVNLADNSSTLDNQNGGFTVFGEVVDGGMEVVDAMAAVPVYNAGGIFAELPLMNYTTAAPILRVNVITTDFTILGAPRPVIIPSVLLRRTSDSRWYGYKLFLDGDTTTIDQKGGVNLTKDATFETVARSDFDGDGEPDVLLREMAAGGRFAGADGKVAAGGWRLATLLGTKVTANGVLDITADTDFEIASTDDLDGDGRGDLLLRNPVDGRWLRYLLDGPTVRSDLAIDLGAGLDDAIIGTDDFNRDGRADILLRRPNGTWRLYASNVNGGYAVSKPKIARKSKYAPQGLADFDGDGLTDVLVRDGVKGGWLMYLLDGKRVSKKGAPRLSKDTDLSLQSLADFNGDGTADALLRGADGSWYLYTLDGTKILGEGALEMSTDLGYEIVSIADFDGDLRADVLLRHADNGDWLLYAIDGDGPAVLVTDAPDLQKNTDWVPQHD